MSSYFLLFLRPNVGFAIRLWNPALLQWNLLRELNTIEPKVFTSQADLNLKLSFSYANKLPLTGSNIIVFECLMWSSDTNLIENPWKKNLISVMVWSYPLPRQGWKIWNSSSKKKNKVPTKTCKKLVSKYLIWVLIAIMPMKIGSWLFRTVYIILEINNCLFFCKLISLFYYLINTYLSVYQMQTSGFKKK